MAETGHPVAKLYPLEGNVPLDSTLSGQSLFDSSESSKQAISTSTLAGYKCQEEAKSQICKGHSSTLPTEETYSSRLRVSTQPAELQQSASEHCALPRASSHPPTLAETHTPSHHHRAVVNENKDNPESARTLQSTGSTSLPVHRSHSDTLRQVKQGVPPQAPDSETYGLSCHGGDKNMQEAETNSELAHKQPIHLQQCNVDTTIYRGANNGESGVQQPQGMCICFPSSDAAVRVQRAEEEGHLPTKCDKTLCYDSYVHHANFEDTFAAYCHPQPIPAPSRLLPRLAGIEPSCNIRCAVAPPPAANHLTLPRLISSVSETGLDAKHLMRCCNLSCSWISSLPPGTCPQSQKNEPSCILTPNSDSDGSKKPGGAPKSPVKEVKWDAEGMTWEVYGASVDPEELGIAIQRHLELQIKETASHAAKLSRQNTSTSQQGKNTSCQRKRSRMMSSIRTPVCCSRSTAAVD
uniref:G protein regulated inducer of neurite outgrowth 2 n=1 Tax=Stegastes partitus TaxID=144197 RepID=A0A3B5BM34_9TELE